jgi:thiosulfate dehydrogenase [quinone] large subunit
MMWLATWPPATIAAGQPSGSTNPVVDDHIVSALALIVVAALATASTGVLGRWWSHLEPVTRSPWLR